MHSLFTSRSCVIACLILIGALGCRQSDRPRLGKVSGTVTYKGKPIIEGDIVFYPETGRSAAGQISAGEIVDVETFENNDGAPAGKMKVTVVGFNGPKADMYNPPKQITPKKYSTVSDTDLTVEINAGEENVVTFDLQD
jgi:hypothetical protein